MKTFSIYCITNNELNINYIGSTSLHIQARFYLHQKDMYRKNTMSYMLMEKGQLKNCTVSLLDQIQTDDKRQVLALEKFYIDHTENVVNVANPYRDENDNENNRLKKQARDKTQKAKRYAEDAEFREYKKNYMKEYRKRKIEKNKI